MTTTTVDLETLQIPEDETIAPGSTCHLDNLVGYVLVQTSERWGRIKDLGVFDAHSYAEVLHEKRVQSYRIRGVFSLRIDALYLDEHGVSRVIA